jgi:sulfur relay (sulfurtransferase) DsrF/TusC family protein
VKSVLVILTQANFNSLQVHESLSATMVLATFGCEVKVLLQDAALSLLKSELEFNQIKHAFKLASNMVDSFEFYDLTPVLVENKDKNNPFVTDSQQEIEFIQLNRELIQSFDHVLCW